MSDLPIEKELRDGAIYEDSGGCLFTYFSPQQALRPLVVMSNLQAAPDPIPPFVRVGPVAEVRPEPTEPTGLGAVVRTARGDLFVRAIEASVGFPWVSMYGSKQAWSSFTQPVEVVSEGVTL